MSLAVRSQVREVRRQQHSRSRRPGAPSHGATAAETHGIESTSLPPVVTVFRALDGAIHHGRCGREIDFLGIRGGVEIDFYCLTCREHVTLTQGTLARLPLGQGVAS